MVNGALAVIVRAVFVSSTALPVTSVSRIAFSPSSTSLPSASVSRMDLCPSTTVSPSASVRVIPSPFSVTRWPCTPSRSRIASASSASSNWIVWPLTVLSDLAGRRVLWLARLAPSRVAGRGSSLVAAGLAPERADPDRELQVALLELDPHPGVALGHEQQALVGGAAVGRARAWPTR